MRIVRTAGPRDVSELARMLERLLIEHQQAFPETYPRLDPHAAAAHFGAEWYRRLGVDPTCIVWLAADRDVRGFLAGEVWTRPVGEPPSAFYVEWIYVMPEYRNSGIGRALFRDGVLPYCRRHGIPVVEGRTVPGDTQWQRRGFATVAQSIMRGVDALTLDVAERPGDTDGARGGAGMTHDSRRYHRRRDPSRVRFFGKQESSTKLASPFGQIPTRTAGAISQQQLQPLLMGLGLGSGPRAQRLQADIMSGKDQGPLASAIRQIQQFAPGVISGATGIGQQVAQQGGQAVQGLQQAITAAQQQMPQWQQAAQLGLTANEQGLTGAQDLYKQMQAQYPGLQQAGQQGMSAAQQALTAAQGAVGGQAQQGAQTATNLAQRYAQQAASPIQGEDLYQQAARRVMQQVQPGLAARGLEAGGAGSQALTEAQRDLAYQFAANQAQNRQSTLQGLTGATSNLGNITQQGVTGLEGAAQGVQQAAQGQSAIGQSMLPFLQALQQGGQNVQQAAQGGAQIGMLGPQLAGQQAAAINQLGQTLMQQYNMPQQAASSLLNLLTAGVSPGLQLTQATAPVGLPSSKGMNIL